ncbi:hypothetical protein [Variovorax saccharolyticus]|uniref:hypothetical protein n=1 Tax=Variovorax saccharolyticus TaxID=3053516 RepID=UPI00257721F6|nr:MULTISPECIES: hypothetical protein [unclassified Variovorax]MDM0020488.1 hypothetical protein [Variovorax sp. J22R187]MDM0025972.1 hypothetical protein [Variovorax sp. J31P216]
MNRSAIDLAAPARTSTDLSLVQWQRRMRQAIVSREKGQPLAARVHCRHALGIALELLEHPCAERIGDCMAALVVSHLNLADIHADRGDIEAALRRRCEAHGHLMRLAASGDAARQQAALQHSRHTHAALLEHVARHGAHPLVTRTLGAGVLALTGGHWTVH